MKPGETTGRYNVLNQPGKGSMGKAYLAEDIKLQRELAFKFLHDEVSYGPPGIRAGKV